MSRSRGGSRNAWLGVLAAVLAAAIGIGFTTYTNRPIVDYSLALDNNSNSYFSNPTDPRNVEGFLNAKEYATLSFFMRNRGVDDAAVTVSLRAVGATIAISDKGPFSSDVGGPFYVSAEGNWAPYSLYIKPESDANAIDLYLDVTGSGFTQITPPFKNSLSFEKVGTGYQLRK